MNLIVSKSKNSATYYVQKSFSSEAGKTTPKIASESPRLSLRQGPKSPLQRSGASISIK